MILMLGAGQNDEFDLHYRIPGCKTNPTKKLSGKKPDSSNPPLDVEEDVLAEQDQSDAGDQFNSGPH